jgi:hypothetical protein
VLYFLSPDLSSFLRCINFPHFILLPSSCKMKIAYDITFLFVSSSVCVCLSVPPLPQFCMLVSSCCLCVPLILWFSVGSVSYQRKVGKFFPECPFFFLIPTSCVVLVSSFLNLLVSLLSPPLHLPGSSFHHHCRPYVNFFPPPDGIAVGLRMYVCGSHIFIK